MTKIIAIAAMTIDGKIARSADHLVDWSSPEDKDSLRDLLDKSDVIVVGNTTYKTAEGPLSKRNCIVFTRSIKAVEQRDRNLLFLNPSGSSLRATIEKYDTVALLGGAQVYTYFLDNGLIDEIYLTIEPLVFGRGLDLFSSNNKMNSNFHLISSKQLNKKGSILLHYEKDPQSPQ